MAMQNEKQLFRITGTVVMGGVLLAVLTVVGLYFFCCAVLPERFAGELKRGSRLADIYSYPPLPIYQKLYVFNLTNYNKFRNGSTPIVDEIGPYVFRIRSEKDINWTTTTAKVREKCTYHFKPELSNGSLSDSIFTLNFYLYYAYRSGRYVNKPGGGYKLVKLSRTRSLFFKTTVGDYFYTGYIDKAQNSNLFNNPIIEGRVAFFGGKNATYGTYHIISTAANRVNRILKWNDYLTIPYYDPPCDKLEGTNGEMYSSFQEPPKSILIYRVEYCKPWALFLRRKFVFKDEFLVRYHAGFDFLNDTTDSSKVGCMTKEPTNKSGTFDASACYSYEYGIPKKEISGDPVVRPILSRPHFHYADPSVTWQVNGMMPNPSKHDSYMDLHARSGYVVDMRMRYQINFELIETKEDPNMTLLIYPVFWEERSRLPEDRNLLITVLSESSVSRRWSATIACVFFFMTFLIAACLLIDVRSSTKSRASPPLHDSTSARNEPSDKNTPFWIMVLPLIYFSGACAIITLIVLHVRFHKRYPTESVAR